MGLASFLLFRRSENERLHRFLFPGNGLYVLFFSYLSESHLDRLGDFRNRPDSQKNTLAAPSTG
jgi:hypothetical protein